MGDDVVFLEEDEGEDGAVDDEEVVAGGVGCLFSTGNGVFLLFFVVVVPLLFSDTAAAVPEVFEAEALLEVLLVICKDGKQSPSSDTIESYTKEKEHEGSGNNGI